MPDFPICLRQHMKAGEANNVKPKWLEIHLYKDNRSFYLRQNAYCGCDYAIM